MPQLKTAALVLGLDSHGLAITRASTDSGVAVCALEKDMSLPGVAASRVVKIFQTPDFSESNLMQALHDIRRQLWDHAKVVLFTVNDRQVEIIGQRIDELHVRNRLG